MKAGRIRLRSALRVYACLVVAVWAGGCEGLGNPPRGRTVTEWAQWSNGTDVTRTRARSVPAAEWRELLRDVPEAQLDAANRQPGRGEVAALVTVRPRWGRPFRPRVVELLTQIELATGDVLQRSWQAPAGASQWHALFTLPAPPRKAVTAIR